MNRSQSICNQFVTKLVNKSHLSHPLSKCRNGFHLITKQSPFPKSKMKREKTGNRKHRCSNSRGRSSPSSSKTTTTTLLFLMTASSTRNFLFGCDAFQNAWRGSRLRFSSAKKRPRHAVSNDTTANENAPQLILPSHPEFPITSVMAPMVAASDYPFRVFLREHCGVDLTFTQMLLAKRFIVDSTFRRAHLDLLETTQETETRFENLLPSQLDSIGNLEEHRERQRMLRDTSKPFVRHQTAPLMVQLAGDNVDEVVQTAMMIYEHTQGKLHGIDLNCGCPQNIAKKGNYGAFLMEKDSEQVNKILRALRKNLPPEVALSAKIRLPMDDDTLVKKRIPGLIESGINFLTVHGRTLKENKTKVKGAHIDRIKLAIETAQSIDPNFPVIANGGMEHYEDIQQILRATGASAAMSSEALLETPDLFCKESMGFEGLPQENFGRHIKFARDYLDICTRVGPPLPGVLGFNKGGSFNVVRGHLFKFLHRYLNTEHQDLRDKLAANGVTTMRTLGEARNLVDELESRYEYLSPEQWNELSSSSPQSSWYRRHRKPDRSVHVRNAATAVGTSALSIEDRKREIRERLAKMKTKKSQQNTKQFV